MKDPGLCVRSIRVTRAPGLPGEIIAEQLGEGLTLVLGANGSGKSTLLRAIADTLFAPPATASSARRDRHRPTAMRADSVWRRRAGEKCELLEAELLGRRVHWHQGGVPIAAPERPPGRLAEAHLMTLSSLLAHRGESDRQLAARIEVEMMGGLDLAALVADPPSRPRARKLARALGQAERELQALRSERRRLADEQDDLDCLRDGLRCARSAAVELRGVQALLQLAELRRRHARAQVELARYDDRAHVLRALDPEAPAELERLLAEERALGMEIAELETELREVRAERGSLGLRTPLPAADRLVLLSERASAITRSRASVDQLEEAARRARARADAASDSVELIWPGGLAAARAAPGGIAGQIEGTMPALLEALALHERIVRLESALALAREAAASGTGDSASLEASISMIEAWCPRAVPGWSLMMLVAAALLPPLSTLSLADAMDAALPAWSPAAASALLTTLALAGLVVGDHGRRRLGRRLDGALGGRGWRADPAARLRALRSALEDTHRAEHAATQVDALSAELARQRASLAALEGGLARGAAGSLAMTALVRGLEHVIEADREALAAEREATLARRDLDARLDAQLGELVACGADGATLDARPDALRVAFSTLADSITRARALDERASGLASALEQRRAALGRAAERRRVCEERWALRPEASPDQKRAALIESVDALPGFRSAVQACALLADRIRELETELPPLEGTADSADQDADLLERAERLEAEAGRAEEFAARIAAIEARIEIAGEGDALERAAESRDRARLDLGDALEASRRSEAQQCWIEWVRADAAERSRPAALERASLYFACFTGQRWGLAVEGEGGDARFVARAPGGDEPPRPLAALSDGTRMQALLAARLAFVEGTEAPRAPLLFDEALAASDPERFEAVAASLVRLAEEGRQVLVASSDPNDFDRFARMAARLGASAPARIDMAQIVAPGHARPASIMRSP